jgi:aquaporin related protein
VNPARSLAPCIVNRSFTSYHWIYWVGPTAGTILAVLMYKLIKALEYESIGAEEDDQDVIPQTDARKPSSVIPLRSVHSGGLEPISRVSATPENPPTKTHTPPTIVTRNGCKKPQSELPECVAD